MTLFLYMSTSGQDQVKWDPAKRKDENTFIFSQGGVQFMPSRQIIKLNFLFLLNNLTAKFVTLLVGLQLCFYEPLTIHFWQLFLQAIHRQLCACKV